MVKFVEKSIVFSEIPDRVTLAFSISNCQNKCKGCHSSFLRSDIGTELTENLLLSDEYRNIIEKCNCILFLGEGNDIDELFRLNDIIKKVYGVDTAIYSGRDYVEDIFFEKFDFVKVGSYQQDMGALDKETTNQKLYYHRKNITYKFWKKDF